jgi:hypothetical protein
VVPLLRLAEPAGAAAIKQGLKQGLKQLYAAARKGAAIVPAAALQALTSSLLTLTVLAACGLPLQQQQQQPGHAIRAQLSCHALAAPWQQQQQQQQ